MMGLDLVQEHHERSSHLDESLGRYSAYTIRLKTIIATGSRYIAYSSDIGEAFRPLTRPNVVRAAYGISWAYIFADVGYTCWKANDELDKTSPSKYMDLGWIAARRAVFQTLASLVLPAVTIHSVVKYSAPLFARHASKHVRAFGPTLAGLLAVPLLPIMFDHPVEHAVDTVFDEIEYRLASLMGNTDAKKVKDMNKLTNEYSVSSVTESESSSSPLFAKLAVLGLGVDLVYLPRLRQLHLARRILAPSEAMHFQTVSPTMAQDDCLRFLATRWTCKEATYKAVYPHLALRATDIAVHKDGGAKPTIVLERPTQQYHSASGRNVSDLVARLRFHASVSHDGDYVMASVLAEDPSAA
ncbi:hypothetical protein Malapachy_3824 [Malassezia pachydermatis]|uniref:Mitochondrial fission process protein 1 n=1 Tax=Malassezia pachydermatis TaxID=77020 RepID=A0A0M9VPG1_9BASI|nr:hypothetical protein Malapachy_3824 [Malassezia pachydermatis]KOS14419.1 hypothetical protein Malapachy_3824 [Malassezia pachydermatis]